MCWYVLSLVVQVGCHVEEYRHHLVLDHHPRVHSRHSSARYSDDQGCQRDHVGLGHSHQERNQEGSRVHLRVAFVDSVVIEGSVEVVVVEREGVAERGCVDDVEEEVVGDSQTAMCLSCMVTSDMGLWNTMREVVTQLTATAAVVTPIEVSFPLVASLASVVGFATGYCVVEERYTCQSSRYWYDP